MVAFDTFQLPEPVLRALADMGFTTASPIQAAAIPPLLEGRDIIAQAQTGTGKTAAFGIPLVINGMNGRPGLVLVPTRELAQQVAAEIDRIGIHAGITAIALYGGASFQEQARAIDRDGPMVIVATPGRLRDHLERGTLVASAAKLVVLDEADEMLKMGFVDEVEAILQAVGKDRQTLLFSATIPEPVARLAEQHANEPEWIVAESNNKSVATSNTEQLVVGVERYEKCDALIRILSVERPTGTLIFRHTRESVDELVSELRRKSVRADSLHGGMSQDARESVLERLRSGHGGVVVATNVAARGLDVDCISHVFNYDAPREAASYVHRIGRTGRAGREGRSFLFVTRADQGRLRGIERVLGARLAWHAVPSDEDVQAAVAVNTAKWLSELELQIQPAHRAIVEDLVAKGADPAALAAKLLGRLAGHEGLRAPVLEPRRGGVRAQPQNDRAHNANVRMVNTQPAGGVRVPLVLDVGGMDGVRPGDIVGALANEGGLVGADIGRIDILPRMSVAEVPESRVDALFASMERATIRGRNVRLRVADRWEFRAVAR